MNTENFVAVSLHQDKKITGGEEPIVSHLIAM